MTFPLRPVRKRLCGKSPRAPRPFTVSLASARLPMTQILSPASSLRGTVSLPADKSISHRSAMLSALADGTCRIHNYPQSADPQSTLEVLRGLGVSMHRDDDDVLVIEGVGIDGLRPPDAPLDCGNSGTTMRLMSGILAGQPFGSVLTGDDSLQQRPMKRVADPMKAMGGRVILVEGHAPIRLRPSRDGLPPSSTACRWRRHR